MTLRFSLSTKAETLAALSRQPTSFIVPPLHYFTVSSWRERRASILSEIRTMFPDALLAVRSSALTEDQESGSMAGAYTSHLNVDGRDTDCIGQAVDAVIASFPTSGDHQVLIQPMVEDVEVSGVIATHNIDDGSPYYVINYDDETGRTDTVTGGKGIHKTVMIYRGASEHDAISDRLRKMLLLARELESIFDNSPLNIEFCLNRKLEAIVLQIRPIAVSHRWAPELNDQVERALHQIERFLDARSRPRAGLAGSKTTLGNMPDWNPAEILGPTPRPLAVSLYRHIITDTVWSEARTAMGYRSVPGEKLLVTLAGIPYIDVRVSLNSLLPSGLPSPLEDRLINGWIDYLDNHPELHDKVEFDIAQTVLDFSFDQSIADRLPGVLTNDDKQLFREALKTLTLACFERDKGSSDLRARALIARLEAEQSKTALIGAGANGSLDNLFEAIALLARCRSLGTFAFAIFARQAFIAEAILRSAYQRGALSEERIQEFKLSAPTVMSRFANDLQAVLNAKLSAERFFANYGHLRPGTYDICSLCYADRPELFASEYTTSEPFEHGRFELTSRERAALTSLFREAGLETISPDRFLAFANDAIIAREYSKFVFSRDLSNALEQIKLWGAALDLQPEDLSFLDFSDLDDLVTDSSSHRLADHINGLVAIGRDKHTLSKSVKLSYLIRDSRDIRIVLLHRSAPTFVTNVRLEANLTVLTPQSSADIDLAGRIVCIESADPGFDWIFLKGIAGLITKYGGVNSHMTIRAAEISLPAAIGCGETNFNIALRARAVELNCADKILRFIDHEV